ncbi:threonine-phosphate decarboxylase CobD [Coleofasciculus sp. FACHB-SPT36]|uniref:threonine-phosphate decarboxylase CobD n=1 Tax=Cyanophyceae TaxID=3028117 RepID=UPI00168B3392|nr:threonine-phosphate decarboxylase CobD [Coleofasciculus sp. FACHB-SPT36]MBD2540144.1 threonine-phosphate decarboxylase [Coleofasciculus sp. FACHB-SPT36]
MTRPVHGGNLAWAAALAGCSPDLIVDFSASINPLGPPQSALAAIGAHLERLRAYPDPDYAELRVSLGQLHQLPPDWILPGNGSAELLTWASWDLSELTGTCLVTPAFGDYWRALWTFSANVHECPLPDFRSSILDLRFPIQNPKSKIQNPTGLLVNNPHNPTGQMFLRETLIPYLKQFALVVMDEAFMDFLPPSQQQSLIPVVQDYPNLVILRSLTKFYSLPGLRLGYAIAHPDRLRRWQQWRDPWPVNTLAAAAGVAVVQDTQFQQQTWDWLEPAKSHLFQGLAQIPGLQPLPGAANFLLVESEQPSSQVQEKLLKQSKILIRDCLSFPELGDRYFRVAVRSEVDNQRLIDGLAAIL